MMDFQREPEPVHESVRCEKCHDEILSPRLTSEGDPYCQHCGHVFGHSVQPSVWVCEGCGDVRLDIVAGDDRPYCNEGCNTPLTCMQAQPSRLYGAGTGDDDLELGLAMLYEAQEAELELGSDILRDSQSTGN